MGKTCFMFRHKRYTILIKEVKNEFIYFSVSFRSGRDKIVRNDRAKITVGKKGISFRLFSEDVKIPKIHIELIKQSSIANEYFQ